MSGHSKWATNRRRKEAVDAKRGATFTKLGNLITVAARGGADQESNFKLRLAVEKARQANMPKDKIEKAIQKAGGGSGSAALEETLYVALGPAGAAFIIEAVTDNKNRTVAEIKAVLNRHGGQMSGPNSALWRFSRQGNIVATAPSNRSREEIELSLIEMGAEEIFDADGDWEIFCAPENLQTIEKNLAAGGFIVKESSLIFAAKEKKIVSEEEKEKIASLYEALDDLEDVNNVFTDAE